MIRHAGDISVVPDVFIARRENEEILRREGKASLRELTLECRVRVCDSTD